MTYKDFSSIEIEIQGEYPKYTGSYPVSAIYNGRQATEDELLTLEHMKEFQDSLREYYTNACVSSIDLYPQKSRSNLGSKMLDKCSSYIDIIYGDNG